MRTFTLRFRDLVTEDGGTIREHQRVIARHGEVWWGWWMRQYEQLPIDSMREFTRFIEENGSLEVYLYDSGNSYLYRATVIKIRAAPLGKKISAPEVEKSPPYYVQGMYPAWFLLTALEDVSTKAPPMKLIAFPTRPDDQELKPWVGKEIASISDLRQIGVTYCETEIS